ncbi:hypothetical protein BJ508DRAFT_333313 [Ascobolus immersus RN42]|uniref:F-box domain-containing protein n=1 Tax=Ascobolus immersus RN42 TaxID=1160509 RepID=A0A3N4HJZ7_ASCIM|nr:hypothetical protein BJ508DRAFT_333313 [Ascobolus immersus RN42]
MVTMFNDLPYEIRIIIFEHLANPYDAIAFRAIDRANYFSIITDRLYDANFLRPPQYYFYEYFKDAFEYKTYAFLAHADVEGDPWDFESSEAQAWRDKGTLADQKACIRMLKGALNGKVSPYAGFGAGIDDVLRWTIRIAEVGLSFSDSEDASDGRGVYVCTGVVGQAFSYHEIRNDFRKLRDMIFGRRGPFTKSNAYFAARSSLACLLSDKFATAVGNHGENEVYVRLDKWEQGLSETVNDCVEFMDMVEQLHVYFSNPWRSQRPASLQANATGSYFRSRIAPALLQNNSGMKAY